MSYLADTNLLVRSSEAGHPLQKIAREAISALLNRGDQVCITPQNIIEFWAVATRPITNNGLGLTIDEAVQEVAKIKSLLTFLPDTDVISPPGSSS